MGQGRTLRTPERERNTSRKQRNFQEINKMWSIHTIGYYYSALKGKEILKHATIQMNLEVITLSEYKYSMIPLL